MHGKISTLQFTLIKITHLGDQSIINMLDGTLTIIMERLISVFLLTLSEEK